MDIFLALVAAAAFCFVASMIEFFIEKKPRPDPSAMLISKRRSRRYR